MKKLLPLFIAGLVVFSGCTWFQQPASDDQMMEDENVTEDVVTEEPTTEEPTVEDDNSMKEETMEEETMTEEDSMTEEPSTAEASGESPEVTLAKCITESGAKLYTASWCGHCKNQKEAFADGLEYLDNNECAEGDGWSDVCTDAGVKAVPTWIFGDGTVKTGNTPLETLAELTDCEYNA